MQRFIKHFIQDLALWAVLFVAVYMPHPYSQYAENAIGFYGVLLLVLGAMIILVSDKLAQDFADDPKWGKRPKLHDIYAGVTTVIEIGIVAALGWYWVAVGFLFAYIASGTIRQKVTKLKEQA